MKEILVITATFLLTLGFSQVYGLGCPTSCVDSIENTNFSTIKECVAEHFELAKEAFEDKDYEQGLIELDIAHNMFGALLKQIDQ